MINVVVWGYDYVEIERKAYNIEGADGMVTFLKDLLDKVYYSGETVCLERATVIREQGKSEFTEIDRWGK